jgi:mono/diheme cytochrome c family protein
MKTSIGPAILSIAKTLLFACAAVGQLHMAALAAEPVLQVEQGTQARQWSRTQLLAHPSVQTIDIAADVAYGRPMRYRAVPVGTVLPKLAPDGSIQFTASDGFVANLPAALLAGGAGKAQAWIAVEAPDAPWPELKPKKGSAGPFYLVWTGPEKSGISSEQWPYQIAKIAEALPLAKRYPQMAPKGAAAGSAEQRGMNVFVTNCAVCHQINRGGDAQIGPDLAIPHGPTEYLQEAFLRKLIRDPASVRNWSQRTMPGFSAATIPDSQLDDLLAYLRQMARQRAR